MSSRKQPEFPEDLVSLEARALLSIAGEGKFTQDMLGVGYGNAVAAMDALNRLGWHVRQIVQKPPAFGIDATNDPQARAQICLDRLKSRAFAEWRDEAAAAIAGEVAKPKSKRTAPKEPSAFNAASYTCYPGAPLQHPPMNSPAIRTFFALIHLGKATPANTGMDPLAFVATSQIIVEGGWPVETSSEPSIAWDIDAVDPVTLLAWRQAFGQRGRAEALAGTLGRPEKR